MGKICAICGCTQFQAIAEAKTLGLEAELVSGSYTCCQVASWADEQRFAWMNAAREDAKCVGEITRPESAEQEAMFACVRRRPQAY